MYVLFKKRNTKKRLENCLTLPEYRYSSQVSTAFPEWFLTVTDPGAPMANPPFSGDAWRLLGRQGALFTTLCILITPFRLLSFTTINPLTLPNR